MKKNVRLLLLFALIAVMIVMTAVCASAADVATGEEFKAAVAAGGEINLTGDITLTEGIDVTRNVAIKGNGYTITFTAGTALETPVSAHASNATRQIESYAFNFVGGTVTLSNVTVAAPADGTAAIGARTGIFLISGEFADVTLNDTKTDGGYITVMFGAAGKLTMNGTSELGANGGHQYVMGASAACYDAETGALPTIIINGGTISNATTAASGDMIRFDCGMNMTINGGTFYARGDLLYTADTAKGTVITINGGTFTGTSGLINPAGEYDLYINGGSFASETGCVTLRSLSAESVCVIKNATFNTGDSAGCIKVYGIKHNVTIADCNLYGYRGVRFYASPKNLTFTFENVKFRPSHSATLDPDAVDNDSDKGTGAALIGYSSNCKPTYTTFNITNCDINVTEYWNGAEVTSGANTFFSGGGSSYNTWNITDTTVLKNGSGNIFHSSNKDTWNIVGGTYTHIGSGIVLRVNDGGEVVNITNATLEAKGTGNTIWQGTGKLNITGGTFTNAGEKPLVETRTDGGGTVTIDGATFTHTGTGVVFNINHSSSTSRHSFSLLNMTVASIEIGDTEGKVGIADVFLTDTDCANLTDPSGIAKIATTKVPYFEVNGTAMTFEEALAAVAEGGTIKVTGTVDWVLTLNVAKTYTLDANGQTIFNFVVEAGKVTITNLNKTVTSGTGLEIMAGAEVVLTETCVFNVSGASKAVINRGTLTINGASATSTGSAYVIDNVGTMTIENGTFGGTVYAGGTTVINNGTFTQTSTYAHWSTRSPVVFMNGTAHLTINGGTFTKTNTEDAIVEEGDNAGTYPDAVIGTNDSGSTIIINGGTFTSEGDYGYVLNLRSNDYVAINGGTFISGNTTYAVVRIAAMHGGKSNNGETVSDLKNFTTKNGSIGVFFNGSYEWSFTMENVTVENASQYAVYLANNSKDVDLTIKSGTYSIAGTEAVAVVHAAGADLTIEGGSFTANDKAVVLNMSDNDYVSNVTIKGGTFRSNGTGAVISITLPADAKTVNNVKSEECVMGDLLIEGGTFTANNAYILHHENIKMATSVDVTITGGNFTGSSVLMFIAAPNPETKITLGGKMILMGSNSDAAIIKTGAGAISYRKNGEKKTHSYAAGCQIILDGAVLVSRNRAATTLIDNTVEGSTATLTIKAASMLASTNAGYFYNAATGAIANDASALSVKYAGSPFFAWVGTAADENAPATSEGASVRADVSSQGIRFSATVDAESVTALKALGEVTYGMIIAPVDFLVNADGFTIEALEAYAASKNLAPTQVYANIQAVNSLTENADGSVSFNGVIVNVKAANYTRDFAAIAYACVDGTYYYSGFSATDNVRNMAEIAAAALADVKDTADAEAGYIYEVNGKYSKYTAEQCEALAKYCA